MAGRIPLHGYNTNYRKDGVVYHVQTEDLGEKLGAIVTQVFTGGTIVGKKRSTYGDIIDDPNFNERLRDVMQKQHKALLIAVREGSISIDKLQGEHVDTLEMDVRDLEKEPTPAPIPAPPAPPSPTGREDAMRDTVQMQIPPEFYNEIAEPSSGDDGVIIDDFPPKTETAKPKRDKPAPPRSTPVPLHSPPPTLKVTPPPVKPPASASGSSAPPPIPPAARKPSAPDADKPEPKRAQSTQLDPPRRPKLFAEVSNPPQDTDDQLGERSLDEVILSYLAEDLQED